MARPIWTGAVNFGLVTVPVELHSATSDHTVHFRQFERGTSDRVRYRRVNERTGEEVDYADVVKGYEVERGDYVLVEPDELDRIAPGRSRTIDIDRFVRLAEIDPVYFQRGYWLTLGNEDFSRSYGLLIQAMSRTGRAGIATFVMHGREYLAAVHASDEGLMLNTLHFAEDVRDPAKVLTGPSTTAARSMKSAKGKELDMAESLIDSMSERWRPEEYRDTYTERVHRLIEDKRAGRTVTPEAEPAEPTTVVNLFDALSASVRERKRGARKGGKGRSGKAATGTAKGKRSGAAGSSGSSGSSGSTADAPTKKELQARAKELGIAGRSTMSRAELTKAIDAAGAGRRAS